MYIRATKDPKDLINSCVVKQSGPVTSAVFSRRVIGEITAASVVVPSSIVAPKIPFNPNVDVGGCWISAGTIDVVEPRCT